MSDSHLTTAIITQLVELKATKAEATPAILHLYRCYQCKNDLLRLFPTAGHAFLQKFRMDQFSLESSQALDGNLSTPELMAELRKRTPAHRELWARNANRFWKIEVVHEFLAEAQSLWFVNPRLAISWLRLASIVLNAMSNQQHSPGRRALVADYRSRTLTYYGNTLRICDSFEQAEAAFARAATWFACGTGDAEEEAFLYWCRANLARDKRQFATAENLAKTACGLYQGANNVQKAIGVEVGIAFTRLYGGDVTSAIESLENILEQHSIGTIGTRTYVSALDGITLTYAAMGQPNMAKATHRKAKDLASPPTASVDKVRRDWLEARIMRSSGSLETAEALLRRSLAAFRSKGSEYDAALVACELSRLFLDLGNKSDARNFSTDAAQTFSKLGINREKQAALKLCQAASV